jgi:hypothetical protein
MRSKLFKDKPKRVQISTQRWVLTVPDQGRVYLLYDGLDGTELGRILLDDVGNWIYDGRILTIAEQEEVAGDITGNQKEMEDLFAGLWQ